MTVDELLQPILNTEAPLQLNDSPLTIAAWDSIAQINLVAALEAAVGGELSTAEVLSMKSVASVVAIGRAHGLELTISRGQAGPKLH